MINNLQMFINLQNYKNNNKIININNISINKYNNQVIIIKYYLKSMNNILINKYN